MDDKKYEMYTKLLIAANFLGPLISGVVTYYMVKKSVGPEELYRIAKDAYEGARKGLRDLDSRRKDI